MAKYIDVEPLINDGWQLQRYNSGDGYVNQDHASIKDIPPADVRPVVLCKNCANTKRDSCDDAIYCKVWDRWEMPPDGYCYKGKERTDEL